MTAPIRPREEKDVATRRELMIALGATAVVTPHVSFSQQQSRVWRIGYLGDGSAAQRAADSFEPFREGLAANAGGALQADDLQGAARKLGLDVEPAKIASADDIERAFSIAVKKQVDVVIVAHAPLLVRNRVQLARLALAQRLPTMSAPSQFPEAGALKSYGPDLRKYFRRAAYFVDKILKGAKPADLPVE